MASLSGLLASSHVESQTRLIWQQKRFKQQRNRSKLSDGTKIQATLEIIEWKEIQGRGLYLCDEDGFALSERPPEIRAPGFNFGAYLKSNLFRQLNDSQLLELELTEPVTVLVSAAKSKLAEYFFKREREKASSLIERWKEEKIYPYKEAPRSEGENKAQKVFDVCAVAIHDHSTGFDQQPKDQKALSFRLLREVVEASPGALSKILNSVVSLPKEKQELLAQLLDRTSLSSIIDAFHHVEMRLATAIGLRALVCNPETKNSVKERAHIHQIVERNPWLFGESYAMGLSEGSLTNLLKAHVKIIGNDVKIFEPVLKANGKNGRIDIMLAQRIKRSGRDDDDHLIIELKRANVTLSMKDLTQLKEYANVVMRDPKFEKTAVKWSFWLVGTKMDADLTEECNAEDREPGCAHKYKNGRGSVWVKTWGQVVHDSIDRLEFVRDKLNIALTEEEAIKVLERVYPKFIPSN